MNLSPVLKHRYFDANGLPLVGGLLYSYQAGTTTPQATYTDQTGNTPNSNPIVLDSKGEANVWLDPSLSYKFVLQDSLGNVQWTEDGVIGILTAGAVTTASIADGAVTSAKLATGAVVSAALATDAAVDANRPINTNNIRDSAITRSKLNAAVMAVINLQKFTTGSGTYNPTYVFYITAANATAGATYSNNGQTFTVVNTISGAAALQATGTGLPLAPGTLTKTSGTGDATISFSSYVAPLYIKVRMVGGGGGGVGGGGTAGTVPTAGGNTTFGTSLLVANGGGVGAWTNTAVGAGGTATISAPAIGIAITGASSTAASFSNVSSVATAGSPGAATSFGGAGAGAGINLSTAATAGSANTGSGGGGGGTNAGTGFYSGIGGGAGGEVQALIVSPSTSYAYAVGAGGTAGGAGGSGSAGGAGAAGIILVEEYYQ